MIPGRISSLCILFLSYSLHWVITTPGLSLELEYLDTISSFLDDCIIIIITHAERQLRGRFTFIGKGSGSVYFSE